MPVKETLSLYDTVSKIDLQSFDEPKLIADQAGQYLYRLDLSFKKPASGAVGVRFSNNKGESLDILYRGVEQQYVIDRTNAGQADFSDQFAGVHFGDASYEYKTVDMLIYLDHAAVELFADQGQCVMTEIMFPAEPFSRIELVAEKEEGILLEGNIRTLKSIWRD